MNGVTFIPISINRNCFDHTYIHIAYIVKDSVKSSAGYLFKLNLITLWSNVCCFIGATLKITLERRWIA